MKQKHIIMVIFMMSLLCGTASAAWANASYTYAKDITLLGADTQLSNYPYLVSVAKEPGMQADYDDLIFYDQPVSQDGNLIDFEIETYNSTTATVWLNITTLPTAGKTISMYYGNPSASSTQNPTAVWDSDYVGVWHLADNITAGYAWNNYKQPNGVITANASQNYIIAEPSVFYEDGKFKMWMRERHETSPDVDYLGYWESIDGYDWSEIKANCLGTAGYSADHVRHPFVMQDPNSTGYWLYNYNASSNKEDLYYGTNEMDWSIDTYGIFSASDVGGASLIGNVFVWRENTSDWYAIVENTGPGWVSDYATSHDGKNWTFHGQVIVSGFGSDSLSGPHVHKNNGTYYMLFHGNKAEVDGIPSDTYVATSTDRQSWVYQPGFEITRTYDWEGVGQSGGQLADPTFAEKNNELYIYYQGAYGQSPSETEPQTIGLCHLNESLQEVCDHIDAGETVSTATDSTSNNNDGQIYVGSGGSATGIIGDAINFSSTHIAVNTTDFYNVGTVSWWQNSTSLDTHMVFTGNENVADSNNLSQLGIHDPGTMYAQFKDDAHTFVDTLQSDADMTQANENQHVVWTSDGSTTKCFVNGTEVSLTATEGTNTGRWFSDIPNINKYGIGSLRRAAQDYTPFTGTIDEVELSKSVRSADWINLTYQMVVDDSYVTFGAEETTGGSGNTIVLGANKYGMLRKSVASAQSFSTIAGEFSHDICFTWWDSTNDRWESYYSGDSYNSAKSVPEHDSYFVLMDGTGETISCSVAPVENVDIPIGWSSTYLRESASKTLSDIKTDMGSNCADIYAWDHTASGTGAWTNTGTFSVSPNQGILVDASNGFTWGGSVS